MSRLTDDYAQQTIEETLTSLLTNAKRGLSGDETAMVRVQQRRQDRCLPADSEEGSHCVTIKSAERENPGHRPGPGNSKLPGAG